jgi:hypothetical protein
MPRCAEWITACVILHNILIALRDEFEIVEPVDVDPDETDLVASQPTPAANVFVNAVRDRWLRDVAHWE